MSGPTRNPELVKNQAKLDAYLTSFTFSFAEKENRSLHLFQPGARSEVEYAVRSGKIYDARGQVAFTVTVLRDFSTWKKLEQLQLERRIGKRNHPACPRPKQGAARQSDARSHRQRPTLRR